MNRDKTYYLVVHREGRLPCPPHLKQTPMRRLYEKGQIGGSRLVEQRADTPEEAKHLWMQDRINREVYIVKPGGPRRKVTKPQDLGE